MRIEESLRDNADRPGNPLALRADDADLTCAELNVLSDRMAAALVERGIEPGHRVVIFMENSWQAVVSTLAVLRVGAVVCPLNSSVAARQLAFLINDCAATALITQSSFAAISAAAMAESPSLRLTVISGCQGTPVIDGIMRFEDAIAPDVVTGDAAAERPNAAA